METIADPVFRFSTRRAAAFSCGFDIARNRNRIDDRRSVKHPIYRDSQIFFQTDEIAHLRALFSDGICDPDRIQSGCSLNSIRVSLDSVETNLRIQRRYKYMCYML